MSKAALWASTSVSQSSSKNGAIAAGCLLVGLAAFSLDLVRATRPATAGVLLLFFAIAATSMSLAGKTTMLGLATITVLALMHPAGGSVRTMTTPDRTGARR